jgi:EmrB/QacA subfamily drug resistance transporter
VTDATQLSQQQKIQALVGMMLALFLAALDQNVVGTAGPDIQRTLHIDASLYAWITTAYFVSSTVLVPVYGKLSDVFGRKPIVLLGVVVFLAASVLCALSTTTWQLIAARALQGVGAAALFTSAFAVVADLFSPAERGRYAGFFGAVFGISSLLGPLLGGFITDHWGWHWVFLINLPIGAIALGFIVFRMPTLRTPHPNGVRPSIDVAGAVLLAIGVVPLLVALTLGRPVVRPGELGYLWSDWHVLSLFALSVLGLVVFVWWELRIAEPLVDLRLFKNPMVAWGGGAMFVLGATFLAPLVFLPLFMVNVVGVTATASGLTVSPLVMGIVAGNVLSGQLVSRLGKYKGLMLGSLVIVMAGFLVLGFTLTADSTQREVTVKMVLLGLGLGPSIPLYTLALQNSVSAQQMGSITSMATFFRQLGSTVGIAVLGSLFATSLSEELSTRVPEATKGLPPALVARFSQQGGGSTPGEEGGALARFDAVKVKQRVSDELEGAFNVAKSALEGQRLAIDAVLASPMASAELKAQLADGGPAANARARYTVARSKLRSASATDASWAAFVAATPDLILPPRPSTQAQLDTLDSELEHEGDVAAQNAGANALASVKAELDVQRPRLLATVDAVDRALKEGFTAALLGVYRVAVVLALLAFLLTLKLPQLPLRRTVGPAPVGD